MLSKMEANKEILKIFGLCFARVQSTNVRGLLGRSTLIVKDKKVISSLNYSEYGIKGVIVITASNSMV